MTDEMVSVYFYKDPLFFRYNCNSIDFPGEKGCIVSIVWGETHLL